MPLPKEEGGQRRDPGLYPDIEKDLHIIRRMATRLYRRGGTHTTNEEDLFQMICALYLEGKENFHKKPRTISHRIFVWNYIRLVLKRTYRTQFLFEERSITPCENVYDSYKSKDLEPLEDANVQLEKYMDFFKNPDISKVLNKYDNLTRLIIYYRFFLGYKLKDIPKYVDMNGMDIYVKIRHIKSILLKDVDMLNMLKDRKNGR